MSDLPSNPTESVKRRNPHLYPLSDLEEKVFEIAGCAPKKRIRQSSKPLMNKLETEFFHHLCAKGLMPNPQRIRFQLGNGIWYKPDFVVMDSHPVTAYEVKGPHAFRGGFENLKVAAHQYRLMKWILVWKETGQWKEQRILP